MCYVAFASPAQNVTRKNVKRCFENAILASEVLDRHA